jgi:hypothetical protein
VRRHSNWLSTSNPLSLPITPYALCVPPQQSHFGNPKDDVRGETADLSPIASIAASNLSNSTLLLSTDGEARRALA